MSSVPRTEPSIEFSYGASARSASPSITALIASKTVLVRSELEVDAAERFASARLR